MRAKKAQLLRRLLEPRSFRMLPLPPLTQKAIAASELLQQKTESIMQLWEERARDEVGASRQQNSLVLRNSLPEYLSYLVNELAIQTGKTPARMVADALESTRFGKLHGHDRAGRADYSMTQLIFEYHILRQVIFQVLEAEAPLEGRDRDIILNSIEQAVNDAATQFSVTLRETQELFVGTLTHDLRNPLNVVKMGTQLMLRRLERGDSPIEFVERMLSAVERMNAMVEDLLDVSRLRAGHRFNLELEDCDLNRLVQDVASDLSFLYGARFVVVSDATTRSHCNHKELRRVIENIAVNAVKYGTSDTPITLTLQQTATQISLTIHNEGNPITPDAQAILFQQFRRTTSPGNQMGWGLGLFLSKNIIEAHQGTIAVASVAGKGTSFIVKLPKVLL